MFFLKFLLALQFLTRIPVTVRGPVRDSDMAGSMACFPLIGLLLGSLAAGVNVLLSLFLAPPVCDFFSIALLVLITGNMHTDGLMDAADGLFSGKPGERALEIMKDSRVGSHGVTAGVLVLLSKFILLWQLPQDAKAISLILFPALGRWSQVYAAAVHPYARPGGGTGGFTDHVGTREVMVASAFTLAAVAVPLGLKGAVPAAAALLGTIALGRFISRKIGGMTGDTLGAISECTEVLALLSMHIVYIL
ncbi:MAG: adenosylcobinamide-GDP ribazoletransferase [Bacillota bacterium]